jgi:hypothetical protein
VPSVKSPTPQSPTDAFDRVHCDPATKAWAREVLGEQIKQLLASDGPRAFEMPRSAAIAHETGHAITGAHEGIPVRGVRIWPVSLSPQKRQLLGDAGSA